jgi:hypothetical protein
MLDGGMYNGLIMQLHPSGGVASGQPCTIVTWFPERKQVRKIENV